MVSRFRSLGLWLNGVRGLIWGIAVAPAVLAWLFGYLEGRPSSEIVILITMTLAAGIVIALGALTLYEKISTKLTTAAEKKRIAKDLENLKATGHKSIDTPTIAAIWAGSMEEGNYARHVRFRMIKGAVDTGRIKDAVLNGPSANKNTQILFASLEAYFIEEGVLDARSTKPTPKKAQTNLLNAENEKGNIITSWMSPTEAIEEYVDANLKQKAREAIQRCNLLFEKSQALSAERTEKILNSEYNALDAMISGRNKDDPLTLVTGQYHDSQLAAVLAKNSLSNDLIRQLKNGTLVARGVPFENGKLYGDWEYIKSAYWVALTFESHDQNMETVVGGGKTFKGLKIGKPAGS